MPTVQLKVQSKYSHKMDKLLQMLNDKEVRIQANQFIADAIEPYVPMDTGALRSSLYVGTNVISWGRGLPYAHYQFQGDVWGPNIPITSGGNIIGWYSRPGVPKHPTGRKLGVPGEWRGWIFGYTTPNTQSKWTDVYKYKLKSDTNRKITRYLKQECKRRGLSK